MDDVSKQIELDHIDDQCYLILTKINILYEEVIGSFKKGEKKVYNPNIFSELNKDTFTDWIISSNPRLRDLFNNKKF